MATRSLTPDASGQRLDRFLVEELTDLSRAQAQRLIEGGHVLVDGATARASTRVNAGQRIDVTIPEPIPVDITPQAMTLRVVFEDAEIAVVDKPAGLAMHPAPGHPDGTLVNALVALLPDLKGIGGEQRPGIVHRLDKDTSGLVIVAKTQRAHAALTAALAERRVKKRYLAIVTGTGLPREGRIEGAIGRDPGNRQRMAIRESGRHAATAFTVLAEGADASLVEARPETGRTHQIRVHFASIRHPLVGDRLYGGTGGERQMLHAWRLGFEHPVTGERLELEADVPDDLRDVAETLGLGRGL